MALKWLEGAGGDVDGVVAKLLDGPYLAGERAMVKVKKRRSADCVVGGFRYLRNSTLVGSLLLGLYNAQGLLDHVGFTSTIADADRPALTRKLKRLIAPPGFTGDRPDRPSRWSSERTTQWRCRCAANWSSRFSTTMSAARGSGMGHACCAGGRTRRRDNARSSRSSRSAGRRCASA